MKFTGHWYDPEHAGEGILIDEYGDGAGVLCYFFTYDPDGSGRPFWLYAEGPRNGDEAILQATRYSGGKMGNAAGLKQHEGEPYGTITLIREGNRILFSAQLAGRTFGYYTQLLYGGESTPAPEPTGPTIRITRPFSGGTQEMAAPLISPMAQIPAEYTLHVEGAPLTITEAYAKGSDSDIDHRYNPQISGVAKGLTLESGKYLIRCTGNSGWKQTEGYESHRLYYVVESAELGTIIQLDLPVKGA